MKKTLLFATTLFLTASIASALEVTHPFFGPTKGQFFSDTWYELGKIRAKGERVQLQRIAENLMYGVTNDWTVDATVMKDWYKSKDWTGSDSFNQESWAVHTSYNVINDGKAFAQIGAGYTQKTDVYNAGDNFGEYKAVTANIKAGYNFDAITPFVKFEAEQPVGQKADANNEAFYTATLGVYKKLGDIAIDTGIYWEHNKNYGSEQEWDAFAEVSYLFTDNTAVTAFLYYELDDTDKEGNSETKNSYWTGVEFRVAF